MRVSGTYIDVCGSGGRLVAAIGERYQLYCSVNGFEAAFPVVVLAAMSDKLVTYRKFRTYIAFESRGFGGEFQKLAARRILPARDEIVVFAYYEIDIQQKTSSACPAAFTSA